MADDPKAQILKPPKHLSSKVTEGGPGAVNMSTLEKADEVVARMADDYLASARDDLRQIAAAFAEASQSPGDREEGLKAVFHVAHNIKGQGGSFGYQLMTVVANLLCRYIDSLEGDITREQMDVVGLHIDALQLVMRDRMKGDGGAAGQALIEGLEKVVAKSQEG